MAAAAALVALGTPGVAHAASVTVEGAPGSRTIAFTSDPGEAHVLSVGQGTEAVQFIVLEGAAPAVDPECTVELGRPICPYAPGDVITVLLGDLDDRIVGAAQAPTLVRGGAGSDRLEGTWGEGLLLGDEGDDWIEAASSAAPTLISGGDGRDTVWYGARTAPLKISMDGVADDGHDGEHDNVFGDVEVLHGGQGNDHLIGSEGPDELLGWHGEDVLEGRGGADSLDPGDDCGEIADGGAGDDVVAVRGGVLRGGGGDDVLLPGLSCGGGGVDVHGDAGRDLLDLAPTHESALATLDDVEDDGNATEPFASNFRSDIEDIRGTGSSDILVGNGGANRIEGLGGDDLLAGEAGTDQLLGGDGDDAADYSLHTERVVLTLDGQANDGAAGENDLIGTDVEHLVGGEGHDELVGDGHDNALDGGLGADVLRGGDGFDVADYSTRTTRIRASLNDAFADDGEPAEGDSIRGDVEGILGGEGNDDLFGGPGDDYLFGGPGVDFLTDTAGGEDVLEGDEGDDELRAKDGRSDVLLCGAGRDFFEADGGDERDACEVDLAAPQNPQPQNPQPQNPRPRPSDVPRVPRPVPTIADTTAPRAAIFARTGNALVRTLRRTALTIRVGCNELCHASATLRSTGATTRSLRRRGLRGSTVVAKGDSGRATSTLQTVRLRQTRLGARKLRALRRGTYQLTVVVTDPAQNRTVVRRTVVVLR